VEFDPTLISPAAIAAAVKRVGYDVPLEVRALAVSGMTCATCAGRVEKALLGVPGVVSVTANLAAEKASVEGIGGALRASDLIAAVRRAGYGAELLTGDLDRDKEIAATEDRRLSHETRRVAAAIILAAPLMLPMFGVSFPIWLQITLATPVQFVLGFRFYVAAWRAVRAGSGNMDLLVSLGTSTAYF